MFNEGNGYIFTDKRKINVKAGDIGLFCPNTLHAIEGDKRLIYDTIVFSLNMFGSAGDRSFSEIIAPLTNSIADMIYIDSANKYYDEIYASSKTIVKCAKDNNAKSDLLMKSELLRFMWLASESGSLLFDNSHIVCTEIKRVIEYMNDNYAESITVDELAKIANLSKSWFMQKFKDSIGVGATEYLNKLRVKKVCEGLTSERNISELAFECGFRDLSNFNRVFKSVIGLTPREYKNKLL